MATTPSSERADRRLLNGLQVRRDVLGADHVERSMANVTAFGRPIQDLVTEYCWGEVWTRPGLPRQTRSLLNIAMLTALGRDHELGLHVRGAIRNGCSAEEVQEVLLQTAIYCGVPAALASFRVAESVLSEMGVSLGDSETNGAKPARES